MRLESVVTFCVILYDCVTYVCYIVFHFHHDVGITEVPAETKPVWYQNLFD